MLTTLEPPIRIQSELPDLRCGDRRIEYFIAAVAGKRTALLLLVAASVLLLSPTARGATYYVATSGSDSNPGTKESPLRTIQRAADGLTPGDTVFVRGGTYTQMVTIKSSGTSARPITFRPQPGTGRVYMKNNGVALQTNPHWVNATVRISYAGPRNIVEDNYFSGNLGHSIKCTGCYGTVIRGNEISRVRAKEVTWSSIKQGSGIKFGGEEKRRFSLKKADLSFSEWVHRSEAANSISADPGFRDLQSFVLGPNSPARGAAEQGGDMGVYPDGTRPGEHRDRSY